MACGRPSRDVTLAWIQVHFDELVREVPSSVVGPRRPHRHRAVRREPRARLRDVPAAARGEAGGRRQGPAPVGRGRAALRRARRGGPGRGGALVPRSEDMMGIDAWLAAGLARGPGAARRVRQVADARVRTIDRGSLRLAGRLRADVGRKPASAPRSARCRHTRCSARIAAATMSSRSTPSTRASATTTTPPAERWWRSSTRTGPPARRPASRALPAGSRCPPARAPHRSRCRSAWTAAPTPSRGGDGATD